MIVADFSMVPMGTGTGAARYIQAVYQVLQESGVKYLPGPMSTAVETETFQQLFDVIEKANRRLEQMGVQRIITTIKIDRRLDKEISIQTKMSASSVK